LALVEGCKHSLDITVPAAVVAAETERVVAEIAKKVKMPGFRPGKAPIALVKSRFPNEIRQDVVDAVIPKALEEAFEKDKLKVVSRPSIVDLHFHDDQDLHFKVEFEVAPEFELGVYTGLTAKYEEPVVNDEDITQRIDSVREQRAEYINIDPRPAVDGDYAAVNLRSIGGTEKPVERDDMQLKVGDADAVPVFNEQLLGMSPGEEKEFDVTYPEDYSEAALAGRTVRFNMKLNMLRRKELPNVDDDFAQDLGDYKTVDELKEAVRAAILRERENESKTKAKNELLDKLVDAHDFPVPKVYVDRQVENNIEQQLSGLAMQGLDVSKLNLDWDKLKDSQKDRATRDVKASLLLDRIADRESIVALQDEVDKEVQRYARSQRKPAAQIRMDLEKNGGLGRIAAQIRTEKTLNFLFDQARKEA
jgi:trigger factor